MLSTNEQPLKQAVDASMSQARQLLTENEALQMQNALQVAALKSQQTEIAALKTAAAQAKQARNVEVILSPTIYTHERGLDHQHVEHII